MDRVNECFHSANAHRRCLVTVLLTTQWTLILAIFKFLVNLEETFRIYSHRHSCFFRFEFFPSFGSLYSFELSSNESNATIFVWNIDENLHSLRCAGYRFTLRWTRRYTNGAQPSSPMDQIEQNDNCSGPRFVARTKVKWYISIWNNIEVISNVCPIHSNISLFQWNESMKKNDQLKNLIYNPHKAIRIPRIYVDVLLMQKIFKYPSIWIVFELYRSNIWTVLELYLPSIWAQKNSPSTLISIIHWMSV